MKIFPFIISVLFVSRAFAEPVTKQFLCETHGERMQLETAGIDTGKVQQAPAQITFPLKGEYFSYHLTPGETIISHTPQFKIGFTNAKANLVVTDSQPLTLIRTRVNQTHSRSLAKGERLLSYLMERDSALVLFPARAVRSSGKRGFSHKIPAVIFSNLQAAESYYLMAVCLATNAVAAVAP